MRAIQRIIEGGVQRKVNCQECDQPKIEGEVCLAEVGFDKEKDEAILCGWPQIGLRRWEDGRLFISLPLCPSTNDRQQPRRYGKGLAPTPEVTDYIASVSAQLRPLVTRATKEWGWKPITYWKGIELWVVMRSTQADCHNYGKVLFDALEAGGVTFNDRYLIPNYRGIWHDTKHPGVFVLA